MSNESLAEADVVKHDDMDIMAVGEGIELRRVQMDTIVQTWISLKEGFFSPLHKHADEQSVVLISGRLRARCGPDGSEVYSEMEPGDVMRVPSMAMHQVEALEDSVFCEAFGPMPKTGKAKKPPSKKRVERALGQAAED